MRINVYWKVHLMELLFSVVFWMAAVFLFSLIRFFGLEDTELFKVETPILTSQFIAQSLLVGLALGVLSWGVDLLLERPGLRRLSYIRLLLLKAVTLITLTFLVAALAFWLRTRLIISGFAPDSALREMVQTQIAEHRRIDTLIDYLTGKNFLVILIYVLLMSMVYNLIALLRNKTGPRALGRLLLGKYHHPKEETRIFMFLDLKDSTTHAEKLGHSLFSELIQDCFRDLTQPVLNHQAEIVQYVGDEAVLSWDLKSGLRGANCLRIKTAFDAVLRKREAYYLNRYGLLPVFKAGVHVGPVIATEVGTLKREISYHGDVMNTTARIEGQCNNVGAGMLISADLRSLLLDDKEMEFASVGILPLKGKEEQVELFVPMIEGLRD